MNRLERERANNVRETVASIRAAFEKNGLDPDRGEAIYMQGQTVEQLAISGRRTA